MKHTNSLRTPVWLIAASALLTGASALGAYGPASSAQEPAPPIVIPPELGGATGLGGAAGAEDPRQELIELFRKVETRLGEIDKLLYDASAGEGSVKDAAADSGMAKLLENSRAKSSEVISGIDRILEIAKQQGGSCSAGMSGGQPKSSSGGQQQGQPQQGSKGQQQRENTPDQPGGKEPAQQPQGQQPGDEQQKPSNSGDPRGDKESGATPQNTVGGPPPGLDTRRVDSGRDAERWGELPEQYRELFRTEGGGDLPPQYRDWIDAYHRRLNRRR